MTSPANLKLSSGSRAEESTHIPDASSLAPNATQASSDSVVLTLDWQPPIKGDPFELQ